MREIIPSILTKDISEFNEMVKKIESHSSIFHLDISDGVFVNSKTVSLQDVKDSIPSSLNFDVHLMVQQPELVIASWLELPNLHNLIFHIEATDKTMEIIDTVHTAGKQAFIAINPETAIESLDLFAGKADGVQFMTVHPGNYGGEFIESVLDKIKNFHERHSVVKIAVDGAIHVETAKKVINVGAETLVLGSHIFSEGRDIGEVITELKNI